MTDPLLVEATMEHESSIIWMHGLGASAEDFIDMPRIINRPGTRWIFPNAPVRPVTLNNGWRMRSWFDIRHLGRDSDNRECAVEAAESADIVGELIESEHALGIPYNRIVLVGFSQGGAMSLYIGCRYPHRLAGMVCLSGHLIFKGSHVDASHDANRDTPILICHGNRDDIVPFESAQLSEKILSENGWQVEFKAYPMFHEVSMEEIHAVADFIKAVLD